MRSNSITNESCIAPTRFTLYVMSCTYFVIIAINLLNGNYQLSYVQLLLIANLFDGNEQIQRNCNVDLQLIHVVFAYLDLYLLKIRRRIDCNCERLPLADEVIFNSTKHTLRTHHSIIKFYARLSSVAISIFRSIESAYLAQSSLKRTNRTQN